MGLINRPKKKAIRVGAIQLVVLMVFMYLFFGVFYRQVVQNARFSQCERQQCMRRIVVPAVRGNIYGRNGELLVGNRPIFSLELYLNELKSHFCEKFVQAVKYHAERNEKFNRKNLYTSVRESVVNELLAPIGKLLDRDLFIPGKQIDRHLAQRALLPITLINELTLEEYDKLINYLSDDSPIQIRASSTRFYPKNQLACHVLGYTVLEGSNERYDDHVHTFSIRQQRGKSGVEMVSDATLRGKNGEEMWLVSPSGDKRSLEWKIETKNGDDVTLSIDSELQEIAESALERYIGSVVVMDVHSGEVLVLANSPAYDPNTLYPSISPKVFEAINEEKAWFNQALQGLFPPASIFKLISAVSFFRSPEFDPDEKWICNGSYDNNGRIFGCHNHPSGEALDLHMALAKSCNTYMFDRGAKFGPVGISKAAKDYFLDKPTGIELPFETQNMVVPDPEWKQVHGFGGWSKGDTLNFSMGQGYLLLTPLSICCFTSSLAKNIQRTTPTIFHHPDVPVDVTQDPFLPQKVHTYLVDAMIECVENFTGRRARLENIPVAGKTGSAQFKENGKKRDIAWFTCFAPADNPLIAVTVMVREDRDGQNYHGGTQAAPIARLIMEKYFNQKTE